VGVSLNCSTKHRVENSRKEHCRSCGSLKLQTSPYESTKYDATSAGENAPHPIFKIQRGRRQTRLLWKERDLWIKRREGKGKRKGYEKRDKRGVYVRPVPWRVAVDATREILAN